MKIEINRKYKFSIGVITLCLHLVACGKQPTSASVSDDQADDLFKRSW